MTLEVPSQACTAACTVRHYPKAWRDANPSPKPCCLSPVEGARTSELEEQNADRGTLPRSLNGPILTRMRRAKQPRR